MGTLYTSQSAAGYNSSPPPDDGSQGANNQITWGTTIKAKLADPIKALADAINSQLTTALDLSPRAISTPDSAVASDHWRTLQVTGTTTITLSDAATMTSKYVVGIANLGVGTVTVTRATGANTVNGTAADFTLAPKASVVLGVNQAANGYNVLSSTGIALTSLTTPTVFTPTIDSGTTGSLSLKTNNGTTVATFQNNLVSIFQGQISGPPAGSAMVLVSGNAVTDSIQMYLGTALGTANIGLQINGVASATRNVTISNSNGGNPTISTTAGSLAITPDVSLTSRINTGTSFVLSSVVNTGTLDIPLTNGGGYLVLAGSTDKTITCSAIAFNANGTLTVTGIASAGGTLTISGTNVRFTNTVGSTATVNYAALRIC